MSPASTRSVLVVDDDPSLARMLRVLLESDSFEVRLAGNGREALAILDNFEPDVILLDLQMPVMDGRTFYRSIRGRGRWTPVIILSAYDAESARRELGAEAALDKPFDPLEVSHRVSLILRETTRDPSGSGLGN